MPLNFVQIAPEVLKLFVRPKRLQYSTFIEFMELLVRFSSGPEEFYEQAAPEYPFIISLDEYPR